MQGRDGEEGVGGGRGRERGGEKRGEGWGGGGGGVVAKPLTEEMKI